MAKLPWSVTSVTAQKDYTLYITFADGKKAIYDARPLLDKPINKPLQNLPFFLTAHVECGTVVWNDELDIAPEHLYETSVTI